MVAEFRAHAQRVFLFRGAHQDLAMALKGGYFMKRRNCSSFSKNAV